MVMLQLPSTFEFIRKKYRKKDERILTKNNIERIIDYYSVTYEQVRKSPLGKQIFYSKPFVITQKKKRKACGKYLFGTEYYPGSDPIKKK